MVRFCNFRMKCIVLTLSPRSTSIMALRCFLLCTKSYYSAWRLLSEHVLTLLLQVIINSWMKNHQSFCNIVKSRYGRISTMRWTRVAISTTSWNPSRVSERERKSWHDVIVGYEREKAWYFVSLRLSLAPSAVRNRRRYALSVRRKRQRATIARVYYTLHGH